MGQGRVLICGAGIAGPTLAYWLARHGFEPTVIERAQGLQSSGNPVDVRGGAAEVARRMGILLLGVLEELFISAARWLSCYPKSRRRRRRVSAHPRRPAAARHPDWKY